ncbi:phage tail protein, partial [Acinetobacter johnsonii]|uniref:phage tail protein n=1 Tax=Acinetobacter johnsonii TaxID=40214 RepID=UPI0029358C6D|nr:phage tail protein [Acinetobacter johnsonii]
MKRIDSVNARPDENGLGKAGFNDNADLPGQDATYVTPSWFNTVQEELCNLLELNGIVLDPTSKRQLYDLLTTQTDLEALATEIENSFIRKNQIVDNLTTNDPAKPVSAKQAKLLQDNKLDKDDVLQFMPIAYPKSTPPSGYLAMMGQAISQVTYPKLYALYGANLPDMRAYTIRGLDNGRGIDTDRTILSEQGDAIRNIEGILDALGPKTAQMILQPSGAFKSLGTASGNAGGVAATMVKTGFDASLVVPTASENRVKNIAFLYIVKAG